MERQKHQQQHQSKPEEIELKMIGKLNISRLLDEYSGYTFTAMPILPNGCAAIILEKEENMAGDKSREESEDKTLAAEDIVRYYEIVVADPWNQEFQHIASMTFLNQYIATCYRIEGEALTLVCAQDQSPTDYFSVELNGEEMEGFPFGREINSITCNGSNVVWTNPDSVTAISPDGTVNSSRMPAGKRIMDSTIDGNSLVWILMDDGHTAGVWDTENLATFRLPGEGYRCIAVSNFDDGIYAFKNNQKGYMEPVKIKTLADRDTTTDKKARAKHKAEPLSCYLRDGRKKVREFETVSTLGPIIAALNNGSLFFIDLRQ